ncbi:MAG TPA: signal peptidase II [Candidatus Limnocylindria bacterium]|nr:signal peptidase II [Candidatus Limnocylindria bacterium]
MTPRRRILVAVVAVSVFVLDRITKVAVESGLPVGSSVEVVGQWVRISHVTNSGAAFGLLPERTTLLSILSVLAVLAIVYYYRRLAADSRLIAGTLGMQLGGAFGNLVDRIRQGYVVDFVDVGVPGGPRFWSFNVADSSIVVGIIAVTVLLWWQERRQSRDPRPA